MTALVPDCRDKIHFLAEGGGNGVKKLHKYLVAKE
jgi:hypothetical protein